MLSPVLRSSEVSTQATSTPIRSSPNDFVTQTLIHTPAQYTSCVAYQPKGRGIRVIQQYVNSMPEEYGFSKPAAQEEHIYDYDLIGAVGLKKSRSGKAAILYHVKWKDFGIRAMTWEPEHHFFGPDLEALWAKHGRVNTAGEISWNFERHGKQLQPYASKKRGTKGTEMNNTHHIKVGLSEDSLRGIRISLDDEETGLEDDGTNQGNVRDTGASRAPRKLVSCKDMAQRCPERHVCSLCEPCLSGLDQMSTCLPVRLGLEQQSSETVSFWHDEPGRAQPTSLGKVYQEDPAKPPRVSGTNGIRASNRPLPTTSDSYSDRSEVPVVCSPVIAHHTGTLQKTSSSPGRSFLRTRTGCLSCRRRKKKCDEERPLCKNCIRLRLTCEGYCKGPRRAVLRPLQLRKSNLPALSSHCEDVKRGGGNVFTCASPQYSRPPNLVPELVQTPTLPTTCQEDLSRSFGRIENLPRLPELDAPGPVKDAAEHSLPSSVADGAPQDSPQTKLTVLPPLGPDMRSHAQHLPEAPAFQIAQVSLQDRHQPRPIEPSIMVPRCISQSERVHEFPGPLRYGLDDGIDEGEARKVLPQMLNPTQDGVRHQSPTMPLPKASGCNEMKRILDCRVAL